LAAYFALAAVGLVAGLAGGLLGIGGSIIMIPAMNELFGLEQHPHQAAALIVNFFVVVPAVYQHSRARAILWPVVRGMAPAAVVAVLLGVAVSELAIFAGPKQGYLALVFVAFMVYAAGTDLWKMIRKGAAEPSPDQVVHSTWKSALLVGLPAGFTSGLLGVGGGIMMVPLQRKILHMPLRQAIANSATTIIILSLVGATTKNYAVITDPVSPVDPWWTTFLLAAVLIPTAMVGAFFGGKLTHTLPVKQIRLAFIILLLAFAARMALRAAATL
jgi:uncharacterized membrane protein YfcA